MMKLRIITPRGVVLETEVSKVFLPGGGGAFEVLHNHAPLISTLESGKLRYEKDGELQEYELLNGFVKVENNIITVCTEK